MSSVDFGAGAILALVARVGGDAVGATFVRSTLLVVDAVVVPALRKVREGRGTRRYGGFCSLKAGPPAQFPHRVLCLKTRSKLFESSTKTRTGGCAVRGWL